jgi:hypothetical protein
MLLSLSVANWTAWSRIILIAFSLNTFVLSSSNEKNDGVWRTKLTEFDGAADVSERGYAFIDREGKVVLDANRYDEVKGFSGGLAPVRVDERWGFIDRTGQTVIEPKFTAARGFFDDLCAVEKEGKWGFINKAGRMVIEPQYETANNFSEGIAVVTKTELVLLIDKTGRVLLNRPKADRLQIRYYDGPKLSEGLIDVFDESTQKRGFIDRTGKLVIEPRFEEVGLFSEGLARASIFERGEEKFGFINRNGEWSIRPIFNTDGDFHNSNDFSDGLAGFTENLNPTVTEQEKFAYINSAGEVVLQTDFFSARPFHEGLAAVYDDDRWGFINKSGALLIPARFRWVGDFSEGLAPVLF